MQLEMMKEFIKFTILTLGGMTINKAWQKKYLSGYGSLLSLEFVDEDFDKIKEFVNMLDYFSIGVSWGGGFESLVVTFFQRK